MGRIKLSTHLHPLKVNNKSIEIKHKIYSRLNVMFENYMVSTKLTDALFGRKGHPGVVHRCSIKKLLEKFRSFTGAYGYRSSFLSSCRGTAYNFIENDSPIQVLCCELYEISQNNFT